MLLFDDIVTFFLFVEVPQHFARIKWNKVVVHLLIHYCMKIPIFTTRTIPKFNGIIQMSVKEHLKFFEYCYQL